MTPNRTIHHPTPSLSPRVASLLVLLPYPTVSCEDTQNWNSQPNFHQFFFSFWPRHYSINNIQTKSQLVRREYSTKIEKVLEDKTVELENTETRPNTNNTWHDGCKLPLESRIRIKKGSFVVHDLVVCLRCIAVSDKGSLIKVTNLYYFLPAFFSFLLSSCFE